jgi:formate hydrogenlyase transcriptional activator
MPPLRDRKEDIPLLVEHLLERCSRDWGKTILKIDDRAMRLLQSHSWPGNVRELRNIVERAAILAEGDTIRVDERWLLPASAPPPIWSQGLAAERIAQEKAMIEKALAETRGTVSGPFGAAARLQMPSSTLESRIRTLGIDKNCFRRLQVAAN